MSTFRQLVLTFSLLASLSLASPNERLQGSTGPTKLYGPAIISASSTASTMQVSTGKQAANTYTYVVELNQTSPGDTTVYVTNLADSAYPTTYTVIVPANQLTATFEVVAAYPGIDVLVASNPNRTAAMEVTVF